MPLDADTLLDRMQLKQQVTRWRTIAIVLLCVAAIVAFGRESKLSPLSGNHVARLNIEGIIQDDRALWDALDGVRKNVRVKALLVSIDTPGGTALGGEEFYLNLRQVAEAKPVVILMRTLCTSAGYMAALGGDYILAREGTITGSIGVIMQAAEFTEMAKKLGITPITIKSGPNKAAPNLLEEFTSPQRTMIEGVVDDFYEFFVRLVAERRKLESDAVRLIADGRILTGSQALEAGLIDELGGEKEAMEWLAKEHKLPRDMKIRNVSPRDDKPNLFSALEQWAGQAVFSLKNLTLPLDGLVSIWQPATH